MTLLHSQMQSRMIKVFYAFIVGGVRLVGGASPLEGTVKVWRDSNWGTVCGVGFDENDAKVICRSLGYM